MKDKPLVTIALLSSDVQWSRLLETQDKLWRAPVEWGSPREGIAPKISDPDD